MLTDYKQAIYELKTKCDEYIAFININKIQHEIQDLEKISEEISR